MKIPHIIHQTWKDNNVPEMFERMAHTWKSKHKDWEYRFWTDDINRTFIAEHFAFFLPVYDSYETPIQKVDAVRYFTLYKYGGFYIDMDFECLSSIAPLANTRTCVFGKEPEAHCIIHKKEIIVSNAFMGAVPGARFLEDVCRNLEMPGDATDHPNDRVLDSTGPFMLSRLYANYARKEEICLLEDHLLYPFTKEELQAWNSVMSDAEIASRLQRAYGIHHYVGTWWKREVAWESPGSSLNKGTPGSRI